MGLVLLAERIADFIRDERGHGLIVDGRSHREELDVRPHPKLKGTKALVVTDAGTEVVDTSSRADLVAAISALRG